MEPRCSGEAERWKERVLKSLSLSLVFVLAAVAGQAQAQNLTIAQPLVCNGANAQTEDCIVRAACVETQDRLTELVGNQWALQNQLLSPTLTNKETRRLNKRIAKHDRAIARVRARYNRCKAKALS